MSGLKNVYSLVPEVVIKSVPGRELAPRVDEHRRRGRAILRKLLVGVVRTDQGQLDRVQGVGHQDLLVEPGVDHGGLWTISADQVDGLGRVLLALGGLRGDKLACRTKITN